MVNKNNFTQNTQCAYSVRLIKPRQEPDYISKIGSKYWYDSEGVTRYSNHWGVVGRCYWVNGSNCSRNLGFTTGYAKWSDFKKVSILVEPNLLKSKNPLDLSYLRSLAREYRQRLNPIELDKEYNAIYKNELISGNVKKNWFGLSI